MKSTFNALKVIITVIAGLVFVAGIVLTILGVLEFIHSFEHISTTDREHFVGAMGISLLRAVDMFLIAIVFFVFSIGLLMLFSRPDEPIPIKIPEWLRVKSFIQLKLILWEAILTTLVVSYLARLVQLKIEGDKITYNSLFLPGGILLIALSLFFLKKGEH